MLVLAGCYSCSISHYKTETDSTKNSGQMRIFLQLFSAMIIIILGIHQHQQSCGGGTRETCLSDMSLQLQQLLNYSD